MTLEDVKFSEDPIDVPSPEDVPEQTSEGLRPIPVGQGYTLQFPDKITLEEGADKDGKKWLTAYFGDFGKGEPMTITGLPDGVDDEFLHRDFKWSVSNRPWMKIRGSDKKISDMQYLLRAKGITLATFTNKACAEAMAKLARKTIKGTIQYTAVCSKKVFNALDAEGKMVPVEGQVGCGKRMYHNAVDKAEVVLPGRIRCQNCGSIIWVNRAFTNFTKD